jgi:uncharacterized protein YqcC (DUF446 family)
MNPENSKDRLSQIEAQILRIEAAMREINLYTKQRPDESAFTSATPFCYDTMRFLDWLQWVMFPKTRELMAKNLPLPTFCEIHPLAEDEFKLYAEDTDHLLAEILVLDQLFNVSH